MTTYSCLKIWVNENWCHENLVSVYNLTIFSNNYLSVDCGLVLCQHLLVGDPNAAEVALVLLDLDLLHHSHLLLL